MVVPEDFGEKSKPRNTFPQVPFLGPTVELEGHTALFGALETPNKVTSESRRRLELVQTFSKTPVRSLGGGRDTDRTWRPSLGLGHDL